MTEQPTSPLARFLAAVEKLPPYEGLTYRGLPPDAPVPTTSLVTRSVVATSRDPRVASEGRSLSRVLALVCRSGRDISPLSAHPSEREVVLLPGTAIVPVGRFTEDTTGLQVVIVEEIVADPDARAAPSTGSNLPSSREELVGRVARTLREAWALRDLPEQTAGKFSGPLA